MHTFITVVFVSEFKKLWCPPRSPPYKILPISLILKMLVITPDWLLFQSKFLYLYKLHGGWVSPSAQLVWLPTIYLLIYLHYITLTDYILTIPLLIRRGVHKSEHVSEPFKLFSSKRFGEDVCNLIICGTMSKMDCLGFYMMSNQMILCVDVFGSIMESKILSQLDCRSIVDQ